MNTRKMRHLKLMDYIKVSTPLILLLCVFFLKSMIQSNIDSILDEKLAGVKSNMVLNVDKSDSDFIEALLDSQQFSSLDVFLLSSKMDNPFLKGLFNYSVKPAEEKTEESTTEGTTTEIAIPAYTVSTVFNGNVKRYAVVSNIVVNVGSVLPNGDVVTDIKNGKVLIEGQWGKQWFYVTY